MTYEGRTTILEKRVFRESPWQNIGEDSCAIVSPRDRWLRGMECRFELISLVFLLQCREAFLPNPLGGAAEPISAQIRLYSYIHRKKLLYAVYC
jgi:hypothetical protein